MKTDFPHDPPYEKNELAVGQPIASQPEVRTLIRLMAKRLVQKWRSDQDLTVKDTSQ